MLVQPTSFHCSFSMQLWSIWSLPFSPTCKKCSSVHTFSVWQFQRRSPAWAPLLKLLLPFPLLILQHRIAEPSAVETWSQSVSAAMHHLERNAFGTFFLLQPLVFPPPLKGAGSVGRGGGRSCQWKPESGKHGLEIEKEKKKRTIFSKGPKCEWPFRS